MKKGLKETREKKKAKVSWPKRLNRTLRTYGWD